MSNAQVYSCPILRNPTDPKYAESIRLFQGCPTIAATKGGRLYLGWYAGGTREPHMDNYNLLSYSDDQGQTWSAPLLVIPSSYELRVHALDIQLWTDPDGALHVCWVQNNTRPANDGRTQGVFSVPGYDPKLPAIQVDGYIFDDFQHAEWEVVCQDPDAADPVFSEPRYLASGFLRCKPLVMDNGEWLCFHYDQLSSRYAYTISSDKGNTYQRYHGPEKVPTPFDESMAYQKRDGSIRMLARTFQDGIAETTSYDYGRTWEDAKPSGIAAPSTRLYVSRTPTGRILLVYNDDPAVRRNMTVCLSEDDGVTWKYRRTIDPRENLSYPDVDFVGNRIYLTYDRGRTEEREILFLSFTEADIMDESYRFTPIVISKP